MIKPFVYKFHLHPLFISLICKFDIGRLFSSLFCCSLSCMKYYTSFRTFVSIFFFFFFFLFNPILFRAYKSFLIQSRVYEFSTYSLFSENNFSFSILYFIQNFWFLSFLIRYYFGYINRFSFDQNFIFKFSSLFLSSFSDKFFFNPYEILYYNSFRTFISILFFFFFSVISLLLEVKSFFIQSSIIYHLSLILWWNLYKFEITHTLSFSRVYFFWLFFRRSRFVSIYFRE